MRVIFAGTPEFARVALERLQAAGLEIPLVLTQPDRPAGRGMKLQASAVKEFAAGHGMPVAQPRSLRLDGKYPEDAQAARDAIDSVHADAMVVAAYGLILPQWVLDAPRLGAFNIHASLLPRWRGAAPIHRAIEAGDERTGVTIMQMDAGLDTGDMLLTESLAIAADDTTGSLHDKLAPMGGRLMVDALKLAGRGGLKPQPQPAQGVTYAHKIEKHEAAIDWTQDAQSIARRVRAFNPFPGATGTLRGEVIKLWLAAPVSNTRAAVAAATSASAAASAAPGTILAISPEGLDIACGTGVLRATQLQRAGGKRMSVADFQRGFALEPRMAFEPR